jgi:small-conductance mechanosensitive channel
MSITSACAPRPRAARGTQPRSWLGSVVRMHLPAPLPAAPPAALPTTLPSALPTLPVSAASSPTSTTSPTGSVGAAATDGFVPSELGSWVAWFLGTPLRLVLTALVGVVVLVLLRRMIRTVTEHLADGTFLDRRGLRQLAGTGVGTAVLASNPLAAARRAQRARTIGSVLRSTATLVVGAIVVLLMLDDVGVNIMPLVASAGVAGVALGFGAQSLVKDFLSGMFLLLEDQYGVGDTITVGDVSGTVEAVALRITKIRDATGTLWYVRNGEILKVGNKTQGWARVSIDVGLPVDANLDLARATLTRAGERLTEDTVLRTYLQEQPRVVGIESLSASSVSLKLEVKTDPAMQWDVARALREAVRTELASAGVSLAGE